MIDCSYIDPADRDERELVMREAQQEMQEIMRDYETFAVARKYIPTEPTVPDSDDQPF